MDQDPSYFETDPALDRIRTSIPEGKPDWTENIAWTMHDPKTNVSIFGHLGRLQPNRRIWEGLSLLYLPDGSAYANRSLGVSLSEARNGHYHYQPLIPGKLWRLTFDGAAQRAEPADLRQRAIGDEVLEEMAYDLLFEAIEPVFNMHKSSLPSARMHLEHAGRMRGVVKIGQEAFDIDCTGYRDHSVSQRTFTTLDSETWAHAAFPSGRVFSLLEVTRGDRRIRAAASSVLSAGAGASTFLGKSSQRLMCRFNFCAPSGCVRGLTTRTKPAASSSNVPPSSYGTVKLVTGGWNEPARSAV